MNSIPVSECAKRGCKQLHAWRVSLIKRGGHGTVTPMDVCRRHLGWACDWLACPGRAVMVEMTMYHPNYSKR